MYTTLKNNLIIISMLKKYGIKHLVLSAGSRNMPFVHSVENDDFFKCYSVVDERSAAYFAMGISQQINSPVVLSCTSSTATTNYYPAITEAYYLGIPLLVITADRDPYYLGQLEDQMIDQIGMYGNVCRKSIQLPIVNTEDDFWYCERLVNEAFLELSHGGCAPVHINVPTSVDLTNYSTEKLPNIRKINRYSLSDNQDSWLDKVSELSKYKKILVICGQTYDSPAELKEYLELFFAKYNCIIAIDHMSNLTSPDFVETSLLTHYLSSDQFADILPDLVISFGGNFISQFKKLLRENYKKTEHWLINESGNVVDSFKCLHEIFECNSLYFFKFFVEKAGDINNNRRYYNTWIDHINDLPDFEFDFSNVSVIKELTIKIPDYSILHLSVLNSIRITNFFSLSPTIRVFANMGSHGIDGCMSTFLGQAFVSEKLSFLVIGDLSFFYDMNSLRIRHIGENVRILLINNRGGAEFLRHMDKNDNPTIDMHTSARHLNTAKGWAESVGFKYMTSSTQIEYIALLDDFVSSKSESPILFEVITDMESDAEVIKQFYNLGHLVDKTVIGKAKNQMKRAIGNKGIERLKSIIRK